MNTYKAILIFACICFFAPSIAIAKRIDMSGQVSYEIVGNNIIVSVAELANRGDTASNILNLQAFVSIKKYTGDTLSGYFLLDVAIGELPEGTLIDNIVKTSAFLNIPLGNYYITINIAEFNGVDFFGADYHVFTDKIVLDGGGNAAATENAQVDPEPPDPQPITIISSDGDSGSGGGCFISSMQ